MIVEPLVFDFTRGEVTGGEGRYRQSDPETSKKAAHKVKAGTQRVRILAALASSPDGLNGWEAAKACDISRVHGATTRLNELVELGLAYRTGATRPTDTGCEALVFFASERGLSEAQALRGGE